MEFPIEGSIWKSKKTGVVVTIRVVGNNHGGIDPHRETSTVMISYRGTDLKDWTVSLKTFLRQMEPNQ